MRSPARWARSLSTSQGVASPLLTGPLDTAQRILAIVAGLLMIAMALQFFGLFQGFHRVAIGFGGNTLATSLRSLLATRSRAAPIAFGVFNGFLPCPLVYAFAAQAASTAAPLSGFLVMLAFGLGTFPAMLMMGGVGRLLAPAWRQRGVWLAGSCILLLGLITLGRGVLPFAAHDGHAGHALGSGTSRMTARGDRSCSHCRCPIGLRAMQRTLNGEARAFCCYGCCIAFQVKIGKSEEWDAAWLLIRLGVGAFLSMNIMLISLLLYVDDFSGADAEMLPWIHLLLWLFATPALVILGEPYLRETWAHAVEGRVTSSALVVLGVGAAYAYSVLRHHRGQRAGLFRHRHHGADAVHRGQLYRGGWPRQGGARPRTPAGGGKRVRDRGRWRGGNTPAGAGNLRRHAGAGPAGRAHSGRWRGCRRAVPQPMKR